MMYFFDMDGTLLDSNGIWLDIDTAFLGLHGISPVPPDYTEYVTNCSFPAAAVYTKQRFGLTQSPEEICRFWEDMAMDQYANHLPLKPGARALLEELARRGAPMAVVTACIPELCRAALAHHDLTGLFRGIYLSGEVGLEKTDPALYRHLAGLWQLPPEECILFDDAPHNCAAARAAGWQVWCVADPWQPHDPALPRLEGLGDYLTKL